MITSVLGTAPISFKESIAILRYSVKMPIAILLSYGIKVAVAAFRAAEGNVKVDWRVPLYSSLAFSTETKAL
jgi:hypothetical protein